MTRLLLLVLLPLVMVSTAQAFRAQLVAVHSQSSLVDKHPSVRVKREAEQPAKIKSFVIESKVSARFGETSITSEMVNEGDVSLETVFMVQVPEDAFMSNFTMIIDGMMTVAEVASKEDAEKRYTEAKEQNKTVGKVSSKKQPLPPRGKEQGRQLFSVSVSVSAHSTVTCELTYQELLRRRRGMFEHIVNLQPKQIIENLQVDVYVYEPDGIDFLNVREPYSANSIQPVDTAITSPSPNYRHIHYAPSMDRQKQIDPTKGITGDLSIIYDVVHVKKDPGLIQISNGYFAHYFSPTGYEPLAKNIVFVIDISGSMTDKMDQTRTAFFTIIDQVRDGDRFQLLLFDTSLEFWPASKEMALANADTRRSARSWAFDKLRARGGTDINSALMASITSLKHIADVGSGMVVFLTDGNPTAGETTISTIVNGMSEAAAGKVTIFSLGFGYDVDFTFLKMISARTGAFARQIHPDDDPASQLKDFYEEISSPLIYDIVITYFGGAVDKTSTTPTTFPQYFNGSELVIAGRMMPDAPDSWNVEVAGKTTTAITLNKNIDASSIFTVPSTVDVSYPADFLERLYAYFRVKDLLNQDLLTDDEGKKENLKKEALELALKYHLVTPLTSFIAVQPDRSVDEMMPELDMAMGRGYSGKAVRPMLASGINCNCQLVCSMAVLLPLTVFTILQ